MPQIDAGSTTDFIYTYYGNPAATQSVYHSANDVWNSNFKMVQHLEETSGTQYDSTSNDNDGTKTGTGWGAEVDAKIYKGQLHDGPTSGYSGGRSIRIDDDTSLHIANHITCEAWFNCEDTGIWRTIMSKFPQGTSQKDIYWFFNSGKVGVALHPGAGETSARKPSTQANQASQPVSS